MQLLAESYAGLGLFTDAIKLQEETVSRQKAQLGPNHLATLLSMGGLASSYTMIGQHADALKLGEEVVPLMKAKFPNRPVALGSMFRLAVNYAGLGRHADAVPLYEETIALQKAHLGPAYGAMLRGSMDGLARSYTALGRHADAVKLAKEAIELWPQSASHWQLLGWALYRAGDWKASIAAWDKSMELDQAPKGGNSFQWFGLAMAHWQLGNQDEARTWFDKAATSMDKNQSKNEELARLRAEAEELLGVKATNKD
jgi:tetratricopeptide (TPR) repeat protein